MKRVASVVAGAMLLAFASGVVAGEKKKCTADPADCKAKMKQKIASKGWLGVEMDKTEDKHLVVTEVIADSPAAEAGFQKGDVFKALNGVDYYTDDEALKKKIKAAWTPGNEVTFTVGRDGAKKELAVTLGKVPPQVAKKWIWKHMEEHHADAMKAEKKKKEEKS